MVKDKVAHTEALLSLLFCPGGGWHSTSIAELPADLQFIRGSYLSVSVVIHYLKQQHLPKLGNLLTPSGVRSN